MIQLVRNDGIGKNNQLQQTVTPNDNPHEWDEIVQLHMDWLSLRNSESKFKT